MPKYIPGIWVNSSNKSYQNIFLNCFINKNGANRLFSYKELDDTSLHSRAKAEVFRRAHHRTLLSAGSELNVCHEDFIGTKAFF